MALVRQELSLQGGVWEPVLSRYLAGEEEGEDESAGASPAGTRGWSWQLLPPIRGEFLGNHMGLSHSSVVGNLDLFNRKKCLQDIGIDIPTARMGLWAGIFSPNIALRGRHGGRLPGGTRRRSLAWGAGKHPSAEPMALPDLCKALEDTKNFFKNL